jgi:hypothetical protein
MNTTLPVWRLFAAIHACVRVLSHLLTDLHVFEQTRVHGHVHTHSHSKDLHAHMESILRTRILT